MTERRPFLTAQWRHLAMLNYTIDPRILRPYVPAGTELEGWRGWHFVSLVGFLFLDTRVGGLVIPFHRNFEEVNLRFYVRRRVEGEWRRGVVFIKEIVPRAAIALAARVLYGENYAAHPMFHRIERDAPDQPPREVFYSWRAGGAENSIRLAAAGEPHYPDPGSNAEFIAEHYWGYTRRGGRRTDEYRVEHPKWLVRDASECELNCDTKRIYGPEFIESLSTRPFSAFLAEGSGVMVYPGERIVVD